MSEVRPLIFNTDPKKVPTVVDVFREDVLQKKNQLIGDDPLRRAAANYLKQDVLDPDKVLATLTTRADSFLENISSEFSNVQSQLEQAFDIPNLDRLVGDLEKTELVQAVKNFDGLNQVKVMYNGVAQYVDSAIDAINVGPMVELVNSAIGKTSDMLFSVVDVTGQSALVRGLTASLLAWKAPQLVELLIDSIEDDKAKEDLWQENAVRAANMGDLSQTNRFLDKLPTSRTRQVEIELIRGMLTSYRRPLNDTRSLKEVGQELLAFCSRINPQWDVHPSGAAELAPYIGASEDTYAALCHTDRWALATAGQNVKVERFDTLFNRLFPQFTKE